MLVCRLLRSYSDRGFFVPKGTPVVVLSMRSGNFPIVCRPDICLVDGKFLSDREIEVSPDDLEFIEYSREEGPADEDRDLPW